MDYIRKELEIIVTNLHELEKNYTTELSTNPPGGLLNNLNQGKARYYHSFFDDKGNRRRIHLSEGDPLIGMLARKEYLRLSIPAIQKNIKLLEGVLSRYASLDPADIINAARRAYRLLPDQSFFTNQHEYNLWETVGNLETLTDDLIKYRCDLHRDWANEPYQKNTYEYRSLFLTSFGLRVRSRGEIVIAEQAYYLGIPNRYDQNIIMYDGSTISPDFTFEDRNYEEFYIEYCGMMDDPYYVSRHLYKREQYERSGIYEWDNIRYIYSKDDSLNATEIKHILLDWVVPRL